MRFQCIPLDRSGFALWQGPDGYWINKANTLQCEIEGFAADAADWSDEWVRWVATEIVAPLCRWAAAQGHPINLNQVATIGAIPGSASEYAPQRLSQAAWRDFNGLCSHRNAPTNDHWDAGGLDVFRVAAYAKEALGQGDEMSAAEVNQILAQLEATKQLVTQRANEVRALVADVRDVLHHDVSYWLGIRDDSNHPRSVVTQVQTLSGVVAAARDVLHHDVSSWIGIRDDKDNHPRSIVSQVQTLGGNVGVGQKEIRADVAAIPRADAIAAAIISRLPAGSVDAAVLHQAVVDALGDARIVVPADSPPSG